MTLEVEVFTAPGCRRCAGLLAALDALADVYGDALHWQAVDVVAELDRAVTLGVRATPALVVNGVLAFTGSPTPARLRTLVDGWLAAPGRGRRTQRGTP